MPTMSESARTAIARLAPSMLLQYALRHDFVTAPALDWGCGRGADVQCLRERGIEVHGYDPHWQPNLPPHRDFAFGQCIYVMNVLRGTEERLQSLRQLKSYLAPGAVLWVAARSQQSVLAAATRGAWSPLGEGFMTSRKTYQEGFTDQSMQALLVLAEFSDVQTSSYRDTVFGFASNG